MMDGQPPFGDHMGFLQRNNVHISGEGERTIVLAHGFGCDQNMWRLLVADLSTRYKTVLFDLVGSGGSDLSLYDYAKYGSLHGYADDLLEIVTGTASSPVIHIGHSVSSMIGMLAAIKAPELFAANVMIGPSPSFINDGNYVGGFERSDIEDLLTTLDNNYLGWSSNMAPAIMGAPDRPELADELTNSFCRTDPDIARHFAHITFLADHRADLASVTTPTLIVQSNDDLLAPIAVGEYMHDAIRESTLAIVENVGHCPHLSAPGPCLHATRQFLDELGL
jgi:sigma-B regulation protein RsbQ